MSRSQQRRPTVAFVEGLLAGAGGPDSAAERHAAARIDDSGCPILHVDMDAFFAMVELRDRPDLVGKPVIIGGSQRGVVLSATYEARRFGVHSAMPMTRALRACPGATVLPPRHGIYTDVSRAVFEIFESFTPVVEPLSLDEAFLDVSGARRTSGSPRAIAMLIRQRVQAEQHITCSVGVAATKFVAKIASTVSKPDGLLVVPAERTLEFLHPLPVSMLWGVGEKTERVLLSLGIRTIADLATATESGLSSGVGKAAAAHLQALAHGRDPRRVVPDRPDKSTGADETLAADTADMAILERELRRLSERVAARMRKAQLEGRTVTLKVRYADFTTITRARTLDAHTTSGYDIFRVATDLLRALQPLRMPLRLIGVRLGGLRRAGSEPEQLMLGEEPPRWDELDATRDRVTERFGRDVLRPASLLPPGRTDRSPRPRGKEAE